jgi:hypothetical protein
MKLSWEKKSHTRAAKLGRQRGEANFKTTVRYPFQRVIEWSRPELENQMAMACMFNMAEVLWFDYEPIRVDDRDCIVFEVTGRNYVPLPESGSYDEIKAALL